MFDFFFFFFWDEYSNGLILKKKKNEGNKTFISVNQYMNKK